MIISHTNGCISYNNEFISYDSGFISYNNGCILYNKCRSYNNKCFQYTVGSFCIIACVNYTIISGKRNIMGRRVPRHTCFRVAKLNWNQPYNGSPVRDSSGIGIWSFRHR